MKKLIIVLSFIALYSCNKGENYQGSFIYFSDAAVLQTENDVYGVIVNDKMHELAEQAKAFQNEPTDMVQVEVQGILHAKETSEEGWPFRLDIKNIISVKALNNTEDNAIIKLEKQTN